MGRVAIRKNMFQKFQAFSMIHFTPWALLFLYKIAVTDLKAGNYKWVVSDGVQQLQSSENVSV